MEETCSLKVWLNAESDLCVGFYNFSAICDIYKVSVKKNVVNLSCEWMCWEVCDECLMIYAHSFVIKLHILCCKITLTSAEYYLFKNVFK